MQRPFIIGITGGSGSGKTTFIQHLRESFALHEVCIISQDDYYRPIEKQYVDENGIENFDLPKSIDKKLFLQHIEQLIAGEKVEIVEYMFNNTDATPQVKTFYPAPILIVEGLFVFHYRKVRALLDMKVFFYAQENLKIIRRIKRDQIERGYPIDDVLYRYEHHVMPSYKKYIEPYMQEADLIINNNQSFSMGLAVLVGYIQQRLIIAVTDEKTA
jgi:uridine kinase